MPRPFELTPEEIEIHLEEMVDVTFADLQSQFLVLPRGRNFIRYQEFLRAFEALRIHTAAFRNFDEASIWSGFRADSLSFVVLRTILGLSPPEWADLARSERQSDITQNSARTLDARVRRERGYLAGLSPTRGAVTYRRVDALVSVAVEYIRRGVTPVGEDMVHRLDKPDTIEGLISLQHVNDFGVPYSTLLYERYLGRPFASIRDSVSEIVGDVLENAVEERLHAAHIPVRKTRRAERVPGYEQAPDFFVPDEFAPSVLIEAKIASDDGTARDKVARILRLAQMRDNLIRGGLSVDEVWELVACIDGRGFRERRQDMRDVIRATKGKVFTLTSLDQLIPHTRIRNFLPTVGLN